MSKRVNQRWPDGLYERAEAAAACAPERVTVTDLTVAAVKRALAAIEAKGDGLSVDGPLPVSAPSKGEPKPEAHRRRSTGPAPQGVGGRGPLPGKPIVGLAPPRGKDTQGPTCPKCGALATMQGGKAICRMRCKP